MTRPLAALPDAAHSQSERRFRAIGRTDRGRGVFIVFTLRQRGDELLIRSISGRYMHRKEIEAYEKENPDLKSDRAAAAFVDNAALTQYDLSGARLTRFEIRPRDKSINLRSVGRALQRSTPTR